MTSLSSERLIHLPVEHVTRVLVLAAQSGLNYSDAHAEEMPRHQTSPKFSAANLQPSEGLNTPLWPLSRFLRGRKTVRACVCSLQTSTRHRLPAMFPVLTT